MLQTYCKILDVTTSSSLQEIKKNYRLRAKFLHPDVNKSSNANEQFILLNEAYEYLVNLKTGKIVDNSLKSKNRKYSSYEQWRKEQREKARKRAAFYSKLRYQEFVNSEYYKVLNSFDIVVEHLGFLASFFVVLIFPIIASIYYWPNGLFAGLFVVLVTSPVTVTTLLKYRKMRWLEFVRNFIYFVKQRQVALILLSAFNVVVFFKIGLKTLIPIYTLLGIYLQMAAILLLLALLFRRRIKKQWRFFCAIAIAPFLISLLLLVNFIFASSPSFETYRFTNKHYDSEGNVDINTNIILENEAYKNYIGIRVFWNMDAMIDKTKITYKFADGLLGFKVVKDYEFH